jgi:hypothetical protein
MLDRYNFYWRLEPHPQRRSLAAGFSAAIHDPVWFLARQWQMGEHQGENASSPVLVQHTAIHTPILPPEGDLRLDPTVVPAEPTVEAEAGDWWTMGRRVRYGSRLAGLAGLALPGADPRHVLRDPPPPYDRFAGRFDGRALWRDRATLDPAGTRFAGLDIPEPRSFFWNPAELVYESAFPLDPPADERALRLPRHRGGRVDWFSADAVASASAAAFAATGEAVEATVYPTPFHFPGAPGSRWWEIEDAAVDLGGYPPDSSHFATTLLIDLVASHGDDWFVFPVNARVGHILSLQDVVVTDSFGDTYTVQPPTDWSLFRTTGLDEHSLVVWLRALTPIQGPALENVLLGVDEYSNYLWAVERRLEGREVAPPPRSVADEAANPPEAAPSRKGGTEEIKRYTYVAGRDAAPYWHPYAIEESTSAGGLPRRRFVQRRLVDLSREQPELLPAATAETLRVVQDAGESIHEIEPATIPSIGLEIECRYLLARDTTGQPQLWLQRQRMPFLSPPAQATRFDVFAEDVAP